MFKQPLVRLLIVAGIAFGIGMGAGILGILWATGGVSEPSRDTAAVAPTLSLSNTNTDNPSASLRSGNLNDEALTSLQEQVDALEKQINSLETNIDDLTTQVSNLEATSRDLVVALNNSALNAGSTNAQDAATAADAETANNSNGDIFPAVTSRQDTQDDVTPSDSTDASGTDDTATDDSNGDNNAASAGSDALSGRSLFRIVENQDSSARFQIEEILMGNPTTVIGETRRVVGDIIVNFSTPSASEVGTIVINARTLKTDNEFRDQAIRGQILQSSRDEHEFITFVPTGISGLTDEAVQVGDTLAFQITGDLTVRGTTREETFDARVTVSAADRIEGVASTQILYPDYGITINAPPTVGGIEDDVILEIEFAADMVDSE